MTDVSESSCHSCPTHRSCRTVDPPAEAADIPAGRVVGQSIAYFLLPIVAAIIAAAAVQGDSARIAAACAAFAAAVAGVAGGGHLLRTRNARRRIRRDMRANSGGIQRK